MTAQLSPVPVAKFFSNDGFPLSFGQLFTYAAGTTAPQATYVDSTQTTQNTNPIQLNFRGECNLWLDPTKSYKFLLQDLFGNTIPGWPVDNITIGNANPSFNIIPTVDDVYTLGNTSFSWANIYLGANHAPALDTISGNISYFARTTAEIAASVTPVNYSYAPGVVDRYGVNAVPGTTDMSAAVRLALDCVASNGGMIQFLVNAVYFLGSQIFIPQRRNGSTGEGGIIIEGNNCTLIGSGLGAGATGSGAFTTLASGSIPSAMFESGTGTYSTVSKGGATNWGLGNELSTTIHDNDQIRNINFKTFGMALHLFNFILGCKVSNLYFVNGYTAISDARSFYFQWENLNASFQQSGSGASGYSAFICTDNVNDRSYIGCHVAGNQNPGNPSIGWNLSSIEGCSFVSCSAEQCGKGVVISGQSQAFRWTSGYFEVNSIAAFSIESTVNSLTIEDCEFISSAGNQPVAVQCISGTWFTGRLGINDYRTQDGSNNQILLTNTSNTCLVYIQPRAFGRQGGGNPHTGWTALPLGWTISNGCRLQYQDYIYNDSAGLDHVIAPLSPPTQGGLVAKTYTGTLSGTGGGQIPFCTTSISGTTLTVITKIPFDANGFGIMFDIIAADNAAIRYISGRTFAGTSVFRFDSDATRTVTVSNNGGFFQFAFGGFSVSVSLTAGEIRLT